MDKISIKTIVEVTNGKLIGKSEEDHITSVKHDSRECGKGDLFVAIIGRNRDGHEFIPNVIENGCSTILVSHKSGWYERIKEKSVNIIMVDDTVYAMGELAKYYLGTLDVLKVAVTGSVGKTSTRDMIYYILSEKYNCGRNMKNFNNDIGLPLSIFCFDSDTEAVVLEMGMDKPGEINRLAEIVKPHIAVITNIGISHIENFTEGKNGIFKAKMEVADHITCYEGEPGALVFAEDGEFLTKEKTAGAYRQIAVGSGSKNDYIISDIDDYGLDGIKYIVGYEGKTEKIDIPIPGKHNAVNGTLAIAVGITAGVSIDDVKEGLNKIRLTGSRLKLLENGKVKVIDDTYNASPDSMKRALEVLEKSRCRGKKIAILGDMYELGDYSEIQHFEVGAFVKELTIDMLIAVGEKAKLIADGAAGGKIETIYFEKKEDLYEKVNQLVGSGDIILVKGSRAMRMEQIVERVLNI